MESAPDDGAIRKLADAAGLARMPIEPIAGGWASWTYRVGDTWILRIARNAEVAAAHRRELRLLPKLAARAPFAVPEPRSAGEHDGHVFMVYRRLPGRALRRGDATARLAPMLRGLHAFPAEQAAELLGAPATAADWRERHARLREECARAGVFEALDGGTRATVERDWDGFLAGGTDGGWRDVPAPVLVHGDLGAEHVLVDPETRHPTGLIDFEDAAVGDPAIDFVGLLITLGAAATRRIADAYTADTGTVISWRRLLFYWRLGAVHAVLHGLRTDDPQLVRDGAAGLSERCAADPR